MKKIKQGSQPESDRKVGVPLSAGWQGGFSQKVAFEEGLRDEEEAFKHRSWAEFCK